MSFRDSSTVDICQITPADIPDLVNFWIEASTDSPWFSRDVLFCPNMRSEREGLHNTLQRNLEGTWRACINETTVGLLTSVKIGNLFRLGSGDREPAILSKYRAFQIGCQLITRLYEAAVNQNTEGLFVTLKSPINYDISTDFHFNLYKQCGFRHTSRSLLFLNHLTPVRGKERNPLVLSHATLKDLNTVTDIISQSFQGNLIFQYDPLTNDPERIKKFQKVWLAPNNSSTGVLAYRKGEPIAYASYSVIDRDKTKFGLVGVIGVLPKFQNQHIGKNLLNYIHIQLRNQKINYSVVSTSIHNTSAQNLYKSAGYSPIYVLDFFYRLKKSSSLTVMQDNPLLSNKK